MNASTDAPPATAREWLGLVVLALPTLLLSLDISVLYLALPQLSTDLGADSTLPEYRDRDAGRLDLASVALSLAAILPVVYGLKEIARGGWRTAPVLAVVAGAVVGVAFVRRQRRLASPLLDLRLFANRSFRSALATMLATGIVMAGVTLTSTIYLQAVRGLSPLEAGLWLVPQNIAMVAGSMLTPVLARRIRPGVLMAAGLAIAGVGLLVQTRVGPADGVAPLVVGLTLAALGISPAMALTMNLVLGSAPPEKAGSAASISETSGEFGIAVGVATLGSLATVVYRSHLAVPEGIPAAAGDAAREGLTAAVGAAHHLPGALAADLLDGARTAFTAGLTTVAGIGAAVFVGLAVLAAVAFRHVPATAADPAGEPEAVPVAG